MLPYFLTLIRNSRCRYITNMRIVSILMIITIAST
nr:MAG TPA: hypothetical protein [Bacteriophage sp.]